jgi:hypothetical protein
MKAEYRGYGIEVKGSQQAGLWGAVIFIGPLANAINKLRTTVGIWGFDNEAGVEERGIQYAKEKIDLHEIDHAPARKPKILSIESYEGSLIELSSSERMPGEWNATFDIPPSPLIPKGVARMMRSCFRTRRCAGVGEERDRSHSKALMITNHEEGL